MNEYSGYISFHAHKISRSLPPRNLKDQSRRQKCKQGRSYQQSCPIPHPKLDQVLQLCLCGKGRGGRSIKQAYKKAFGCRTMPAATSEREWNPIKQGIWEINTNLFSLLCFCYRFVGRGQHNLKQMVKKPTSASQLTLQALCVW